MKNGSAKKILRGTPHDDRNLISHFSQFFPLLLNKQLRQETCGLIASKIS
jgi:hypothetical protein